ncbi:MAG TPA: uracil-DNA glycosylase [Bacteroidota bacterium]|nr:uracil-DNA glycosylase [Bacteroidota bacterium]
MTDLASLQRRIVLCKRCPRLVRWRKEVAATKTKRFRDQKYWGKPVPGFGDPRARLLLVGLAPAAHGGNRTGRMFTGDRSGDWLYRALHKFGFANQARSESTDDGLLLTDCYITAACRCAPPVNKLLPNELKNCRPFLLQELTLLTRIRVVIGLGKIGFDAAQQSFGELAGDPLVPRPRFTHGAEYSIGGRITLMGSFHPSQQNTFTGRLTEPMFDDVFRRARTILNGAKT